MPDPFAEERARAEFELAKKLGRALSIQEKLVLDALGFPPDASKLTAAFLAALAAETMPFVQDAIEAHALASAETVIGTITATLGDSVYRESVRAWAEEHAYEMSRYLNDTTRQVVGDLVTRYTETSGMTRQDFEDALNESGLFSPSRASAIAVTETTAATSAGTAAAAEEARAAGLEVTETWRTQDGGCEEICAPLDGTTRGDGWDDPPPAHVHCACWIEMGWA